MGGLVSLIMIVLGATLYFFLRIGGNKKEIEDDDIAVGSAWLVTWLGSTFICFYLLIDFLIPYIKEMEGSEKYLVLIFLSAVCFYLPFKVAGKIVPTKEKRKE